MRFFLLLVVLCYTTLSFSQSNDIITLSGKIVDAETKQPLEYATISIHHSLNDTIVSGTSTNKQGKFRFGIAVGTYTLKVQFLSFQTYELKSKSFTDDLNLGTIELQPDNQLNEIEVVAEKKLVETKFNKRVYNASRDIANIGGNAIDVLTNTPSVRVDNDGSVIVRGGSATILIDGKPQFGLDNETAILKAIPSSSIDKVEIITRSAKYAAEGGGGAVINIITKRRQGLGTNGSIEVHGGIPDNHGFSTFINEDSDKMNLYSTISFNHQDRKKYTQIKQPSFGFDQERVDKQQRNSVLFNLGSDFYLSDKNTLSASFLINTNNKNYRSTFNEPDFTRNVGDSDDGSRIEVALGNTTKFNDDGHALSVNFSYSNTDSDSNSEIRESQTTTSIFQKSVKDQKLDNLLGKVDYKLPLGEDKSLEVGYQGTFRFYENDFNVSEFDTTINNFVTVGGLDNIIEYDENVHAFYGLYTATQNKFSYSVGLRTEISDITLQQQGSTGITKTYTDLFPSLTIGYEFSDDNYISLNYSRSIDRPTAAQINPFISFADERFQTVGNQDLNPFYTDYLELLYDHSFEKLTLMSSFFLNYASDHFLTVIENTGEQTADGQAIFRRIPINSGDQNILGVDLDLTYTFTKNFKLNAYLSPYFQKITNTIDPEYSNENTTWYASGTATISLNNGLQLRAEHIYQSPIKNGLTELRTINFSNVTVSKDLFKKKGTLTFRINDIFSSKKFKYESFEANTLTFRDVRFENQYLLTFTYRFNQKRRSAKDRSEDINKDELEDTQDKKL